MIPGPIECHEDVLEAMQTGATSHTDPSFINIFGECLEMLRVVLYSSGQPFVVSGSGTLSWDMVASNLVEPGEDVLVVSNGFFGDKFAECLAAYGASVTSIASMPLGSTVALSEIKKALQRRKFKLVALTHVDTSTGVMLDIQSAASLIRTISPETLIVVDGVCSVGCESIRMDDWGLDIVVTASQKAIGAPPGLSLLVASSRAIETFKTRKSQPQSYFAAWQRWIPIMQSYEARKPSYFATPAVQLVMALNVALKKLLNYGMEKSFARHQEVSNLVKDTIQSWGLELVSNSRASSANGLTAVYYPGGIQATDLLPKMAKRGVMIAGGLHPAIATKYFRIGHMGTSVIQPDRLHIETLLNALKDSLRECGFTF
ncbi:alanine-glyoxylate aminotransferase [Basidiobolus meristosporus CBS 931.73]|uniref:alanine--glyoxylate transaminase n=1 Tax=Basidiobolus meristosporus CBS 931.73 TaxID=1314790 RepID=A0A1Y1Y0C5_9FUNG|nr:alanine-glyoxylate aminotransferase [Basidiobolus meristosporus CBS 931.73]|eukprot:ORX91166.1 alanine-glyoxylate aminotransferase [Basidiobolus meristosporus CBS 931.73]